MDASAMKQSLGNATPSVVFSIRERGNLMKGRNGDGVYTTITAE